jgi:hypothetical protein
VGEGREGGGGGRPAAMSSVRQVSVSTSLSLLHAMVPIISDEEVFAQFKEDSRKFCD